MEKKEMSMEVRLLLAFLLMGLVLFVTPYFYKPTPAPPAKQAAKSSETAKTPQGKSAESKTGESKAGEPPGETKAGEAQAGQAQAESKASETKAGASKPAAAAPALNLPAPVQATQEQTVTVDTDLYHVVFSNRGAVARSWILKKYKDQHGKPVELVNEQALAKLPPPFALAFKGTAPSPDPNQALFEVKRPNPLTVSFEYSDGHVAVKKSFKFAENSYLVDVSSEVSQNGAALPNSLEWRGGFGDETVVNPANYQHSMFYDLSDSKLTEHQVKDAKNGPISSAGQYSFAGLEDSYFASVFLPQGRSLVELTTYSDSIPDSAGKDQPRIGAAVGGEGTNDFKLFIGPKDYDLLNRIDPKLQQLISWGWFGIIAKPLFVALNWTADHVTLGNYGWAIILLTTVINTVLFPLKITSMKSSRKMQAIQPLINSINEKYKGLPMRDPRQQEKSQELMDLYKKHGVNPVGGCLPMILQLPAFYAFYKVLQVSIELRGAGFLWVHDLSQPEMLAIRILPVILVLTQFLSQKMTPSPGMDPNQQKMMMFMPLVFGYMFWYASAGLVLYWLTSNVVGIVQQWILNRTTPVPAVIQPKPVAKKKSRN
jgi:YidC/Oxa1 family membrane protein insertase